MFYLSCFMGFVPYHGNQTPAQFAIKFNSPSAHHILWPRLIRQFTFNNAEILPLNLDIATNNGVHKRVMIEWDNPQNIPPTQGLKCVKREEPEAEGCSDHIEQDLFRTGYISENEAFDPSLENFTWKDNEMISYCCEVWIPVVK